MCGRISVQEKSIQCDVSKVFDASFLINTNIDLRPTQMLGVIIKKNKRFQQQNVFWGIKPKWADRILINAQAETVAQKPTFKKAFEAHRCVVPCSGWYEWQDQGSGKKQRYYFSHLKGETLYMAGIYYLKKNELPELITLTTTPNKKFAAIHNRMPALILTECLVDWFSGNAEQAQKLLLPVPDNFITFRKIESLEEVV
ncbi:MAG: SOS response-associated peptidase [Pseudomonadota bacterium]